MQNITTDEILDALDDGAERHEFPMFDNMYIRYGDARLTAYRSASEWLIAIQLVEFFRPSVSFMVAIHAFGNRLQRCGLQPFPSEPPPPHWQAEWHRLEPAAGFPFKDDAGNFGLDPGQFQIMVNGNTHAFAPTAEEYRAAGMDTDATVPPEAKILWLLVDRFGAELFYPDDLLLYRCQRHGQGLRCLIHVDQWRHPDLINDELPSDVQTFQMLANALAHADASLYQPSDEPNTHWSHWTRFEGQA